MTDEVKLRKMVLINPEILENITGESKHRKRKLNLIRLALKKKLPPDLKWFNVKNFLHQYYKYIDNKTNKNQLPEINQTVIPEAVSPKSRTHVSTPSRSHRSKSLEASINSDLEEDKTEEDFQEEHERRGEKRRRSLSQDPISPKRSVRTKPIGIARLRPQSHLKKPVRWEVLDKR